MVSPDEPAVAAEGVEDDSVAETDPPADPADTGAERVLREVGAGGDEPSAAAAAPSPGGLKEAAAPVSAWRKGALPQGPQPRQQWRMGQKKHTPGNVTARLRRRGGHGPRRQSRAEKKGVGTARASNGSEQTPQNSLVNGENTLVCGREYVFVPDVRLECMGCELDGVRCCRGGKRINFSSGSLSQARGGGALPPQRYITPSGTLSGPILPSRECSRTVIFVGPKHVCRHPGCRSNLRKAS